MTFGQQLTLILIDKAVIGFFVLLAGLWLNRELEAYKSRQTQSLEIAREKRQVLEKQISEFYQPILLRLERDNAIWKYMKGKYQTDPDTQKFGLSFENTFILPNHEQIMQIIETRGHHIGDDEQVLEEVKNYTEHVFIYKALRAMGDTRDPYNFDKKLIWPKNFYTVIRDKNQALQAEYESLLKGLS